MILKRKFLNCFENLTVKIVIDIYLVISFFLFQKSNKTLKESDIRTFMLNNIIIFLGLQT